MRIVAAAALCLCMAHASPAASQTPPSEAATLVDLARAARDAGDHHAAADLLTSAERASLPPLALRWSAAWEFLSAGDTAQAAAAASACVADARRRQPLAAADQAAADQCQAIVDRTRVAVRPPPPAGHRAPATVVTSGPSVAPWVLVGAGMAATVAGVAFWVLRDRALDGCALSRDGENAACPQAQLSAARMAPTWATAGNVAVGVGLAAVGAGVIWWAVSDRVTVSPGPSSVTVSGRF